MRSWIDLVRRVRGTVLPRIAGRILIAATIAAVAVYLKASRVTVPFVLINAMSWWAVVGTTIVAFGMFGIDEIGVEIEDPFGYDPNDLPLDAIGETITTDVSETLAG